MYLNAHAHTHTHMLYTGSLRSPTDDHSSSSRDRSISNDSFKMDPEDIERISHPKSDQVYTVVNRPLKENDRAPRTHMKPYSPSPDILERPGSGADKRQDGAGKHYPSSNVNAHKGRPLPPGRAYNKASQPPPPPPNKKPTQSKEPLNDDEHDYSDVADDFSSPSPEPLSPIRQLSPTNPPPSQSRPAVAPRRSKDDLFGGIEQSQPSKPKPPSKPAPPKKPTALAGRPESPLRQAAVRSESPLKTGRSDSPFKHPLLPPTARPMSPQRSQVSPEQKKQVPATNVKPPRHRPSYAEVDPDQEIRVEHLPPRLSATDNDMWVKVKYNSRPHQDSLGRRSSSSSNLTNTMTSASGSDCYTNLAELMIDAPPASGTGSQRRHSFTEGDEKLIIKASAANR